MITLHASSLLSKWGFDDGDILRYAAAGALDVDGLIYDYGLTGNDHLSAEHRLLSALVQKYLLPLLVGRRYEYTEVGTIHNPCRIDVLDGVRIDHYDYDGEPELNYSVDVTREMVVAVLEELCA